MILRKILLYEQCTLDCSYYYENRDVRYIVYLHLKDTDTLVLNILQIQHPLVFVCTCVQT